MRCFILNDEISSNITLSAQQLGLAWLWRITFLAYQYLVHFSCMECGNHYFTLHFVSLLVLQMWIGVNVYVIYEQTLVRLVHVICVLSINRTNNSGNILIWSNVTYSWNDVNTDQVWLNCDIFLSKQWQLNWHQVSNDNFPDFSMLSLQQAKAIKVFLLSHFKIRIK